MKLVELKNEDIQEFKNLMIEAFQYGYEVVKISIKEKYVLIHKIEGRLQ